jgi:hypothetical protein
MTTTEFLILANNEQPHWQTDVTPWMDGTLAIYTNPINGLQITSYVGPSQATPESYVEPMYVPRPFVLVPSVVVPSTPDTPGTPTTVPEPSTAFLLATGIAFCFSAYRARLLAREAVAVARRRVRR